MNIYNMKIMQSFDYSLSSKEQSKTGHYSPIWRRQSHNKSNIPRWNLHPSIKWLPTSLTHCITSKILSTYTSFHFHWIPTNFSIPIPHYFTIREKVKELCAQLYVISPSLHWVLYLVIHTQTDFCEVFLASKISRLQWPQCWQMPPELEAEQDFK